jgi:hypothetical protein
VLDALNSALRKEAKRKSFCRPKITESKSSVVSSSLFETVMTNRFQIYRRAKTGRYQMRYQILDLEIDGGELLDDRREHFVDARFELQV